MLSQSMRHVEYTLLRECLKLAFEQRLRKLQRALQMVEDRRDEPIEN